MSATVSPLAQPMRGGGARPALHPARVIGGLLVLAVAGFAILGPLLVTVDPARQDLSAILLPPGEAGYWLGTDHLGRSVLARLAHAARLSAGLAMLSMLAAAVPGTLLGLLAAWRGGVVEHVLVALSDMVLAMPGLLLVVLLAALAPGMLWPLFLGLSLAGWVEYFRVSRANGAVLLASPAVEAARLLGFGPVYILRRHILPTLAPLLGTLAAFGVGNAVLAIGALGFAGIGLQPPRAEWGLMLTEMLPYHDEAPWQMLAPAFCLFILVLGLQMLAGRRAGQ
jgi:peptide/nickel transport system permease protein